jgi:predicted dinucleotide-utilizing enzyme
MNIHEQDNPRPFPILSAWALVLIALAISFAVVFSGCQSGPERAAHTTIKAANIAVDTAMKAYSREVVRKERANDATRATDPGGYLDRHRTALLLHGKVSDAKNAYRDAVNVAVTMWLMQKSDKANAPPEPLANAEVTAAMHRLLKLTKP